MLSNNYSKPYWVMPFLKFPQTKVCRETRFTEAVLRDVYLDYRSQCLIEVSKPKQPTSNGKHALVINCTKNYEKALAALATCSKG